MARPTADEVDLVVRSKCIIEVRTVDHLIQMLNS